MSREKNWPGAGGVNDQVDALQAYSTLQGARSLFFWLMMLGFAGVSAVFWLVDSGWVDLPMDVDQTRPDSEIIAFQPSTVATAEQVSAVSDHPSRVFEYYTSELRKHLLETCLRGFGYLLTFCSVIYCLTLLIMIKISLVGRLGGLADAVKAFLVSLVLVVIVVPWAQNLSGSDGTFPIEGAGVVFGFGELMRRYQQKLRSHGADLTKLVYYGRFVGWWAFAVVLLVVAQWRSYRAGRAVRSHVTIEMRSADAVENGQIDGAEDQAD